MDLEEWELLPKNDLSKSSISKGAVDSSSILLQSIGGVEKTIETDEKIIREIKADPPIQAAMDQEEELEENDKVLGVEKEEIFPSDFKRKGCLDGVGFSVWGWKISRVGALCTVGVAAATICILFLGSRNRQKQQHEKIQFQVYTDDKKLKQMVQQATRLNQAITKGGGIQVNRANISFGGNFAGI